MRFKGNIGQLPRDWKQDGGYAVKADCRHYRLGVTFEGMQLIFERIRFIRRRADGTWQYSQSSQQRGRKHDWLDKSVGPIGKGGDHGLTNMTGYDVCICIRNWLRENHLTNRSLAEVILTEDTWADLREHVGEANLLWSHLQREPLIGPQSTFASVSTYLRHLDSQDNQTPPFIWCDYLSLRQAEANDFKIDSIIEGIHLAGRLVACIDAELVYPDRSFCLVEAFAAVVGGCQLDCVAYVDPVVLEQKPVRSKDAQTRDSDDKKAIDDLIEDTVGFQRLDEVITDCIQAGCQCWDPA